MSGVLNLLLAGAASAIKDAYYNLTTLLLNTSSTNGAQNNTFLDSSTNNFTITRNGNTTQGTFTPFSQTGWSNFLDGSSHLSSTTAGVGGSGDFTVEAWVYPTITSSIDNPIYDTRGGSGWNIFIPSGLLTLNSYDTAAGVLLGASTNSLTLNAWNHVAFVKSGSNNTYYINGVSSGTYTRASTATPSATKIGSDTGSGKFRGYISNFRTVTSAVYTSGFTPSTTPLTAISGTTLLTCQSNRFVDNSASPITLTANGTPSVQAFSPFAPTAAYDAAVVGGSGYFDGSGDYLTGPNASGGDFGSGNFTISFWYYPVSNANYGLLSYADTGGWNGWQIQQTGSNTIKFEFLSGSTGDSSITGGTVYANQWNYVVITRSGSTVTLYTNSTSSAGTSTNSSSYGVSGSRVIVGNERSVSPGTPLNGYLSNVKLVKQANAPASIPTAPDTNTTNTSLLLNFTNGGIYDSTAKNDLETVGNAQVSTTQAKWGTTSMSFDGTGDWLVTPNGRNYINGTEPFTIECWVYVTGTPAYWSICGASSGTLVLTIQNLTTININPYGSGNTISVTTSLSTNTWTHIAATRDSSNKFDIWVNGVSAGNTTSAQSFGSPTYYVIGAADSGGTQPFIGYLDDVRITKFCRYTTTFTPPAAAFPLQ